VGEKSGREVKGEGRERGLRGRGGRKRRCSDREK